MSSSQERPSPPRAGSYILVSSSLPQDDSASSPSAETSPVFRSARPRFSFLLPIVAFLDATLAITLGILILQQEAKHSPPNTEKPSPSHDPILLNSSSGRLPDTSPTPIDDAAWERRKIVLTVLAFSVTRACAYAIIGISKRIRELGVTVAAISILSTLFYVSIANLLFQARPKPDVILDLASLLTVLRDWHWPDAFKNIEPTMPILVGAQMALTLFEWVLYIAVVGVKVPPGGNPAEAKRWARGLAEDADYQRGVDAHSLYPSDGEDDEEEEHEQEHMEEGDTRSYVGTSRRNSRHASARDEDDLEQAKASLASPISNVPRNDDIASAAAEEVDGSNRPLLNTSPARGYGSILASPRTPRGPSQSHPQSHSHGSVRSKRSAHAMSRSASNQSGMYSRSPGAAELGAASPNALQDDEDDEVGDEEAEGSDPDDIIDITPNRAVARKEARLRLARAALPERRASGGTLSTLDIFGADGPSCSTYSAECGESSGGPEQDLVYVKTSFIVVAIFEQHSHSIVIDD
ncbi:hypothetical protein NDA16_000659 [Ustilago loliicola]|nr:hypothetical protein NDA16_000659 [Ustilago loliicola]